MEKKLCRICGKLKNVDHFTKSKGMRDGYRNECKECSSKIYNDKGKSKENSLKRKVKMVEKKNCRVCGIEKSINEFHKKIGTPDGHRLECKECIKDIQKKYKEIPGFKEKQAEYDKQRYNENKESILERKKEYYQKNKDKLLDYKSNYRNDPENQIKIKNWRNNNKERLAFLQSEYKKRYPHVIAWRTILHSSLKRLNTPKQDKTITLLGYSALDLKHHIEKKFIEGMSWENHGSWHIDHICPVSKFDENTPVSEVCALENLQPLWEFDNLSKNNKY